MKRQLIRNVRSLSASQTTCIQPFEAIPGPKPLPLIGNIWRYLPLVGQYKIDQLYENALYNRKHYGPIVREQITRNHTILHLFDPADIETFFRHDGKEPYRRSHRALLKYRRSHPERYNDGGLFPENGKSWYRLRRLFQHYLMRKSQISMRARILDETTLDSIQIIEGEMSRAPVLRMAQFESFLYKWSLRCSLAVFLDFNKSTMPAESVLNEMIQNLHYELEAIDGTEIRSEKWSKKPSGCPYFQKLSKAEDKLYTIVSDRVDYLIRKPHLMRRENSFLYDWLVKDKLDRKDVITFILDCILAGLHTTAYTTTFLLDHIAKWDTDKQDELKRQVCKHMPPPSQYLTSDITDDMPILKDCLIETLRLRPVAIGTGRLTQHDDMLIRNYRVPKGVMVIAHNQTISMDSSIYEQPDKFCPDRWSQFRLLPRNERPSPFARLPFGFGPRICIGQRLISLQINILAARMVQQYKWKFLNDIKTKAMLVHCLDGHVDIELEKVRL